MHKNSLWLIGIKEVDIKSPLFEFLLFKSASASPRDNPTISVSNILDFILIFPIILIAHSTKFNRK